MYALNRCPLRRTRHILTIVLPVILAGVLLAACDAATLIDSEAPDTSLTAAVQLEQTANNHTVNQQLAQARAGTAAFRRVEAAEAAGYVQASPCVEDLEAGGMGYHYLNPANFLTPENTELDPAKPQLLVYEPQKNGRLRLVAVEYLVPYGVMPADQAPPRLFEQDFDPTDHLNAWTLHVWVWQHNPSGMFAPYNPRVSCQYAP